MPATVNQWILPKVPMWYGLAEVRINARSYQPFTDPIPTPNFDYYQTDQSKVVILDDRYRMLKSRGISPLKKHISRVEGQLTPDARVFQFTDYFQYTGKVASDASVVSEDLKTTAYKSLNYRIFDDPLAVYTIFLSRCKKATLGAYNAGTGYVAGDVVTYNNDTWELGADAPGTLTGQTPGGTSGYAEDTTKWVKARELYFMGDVKFQNAAGQHILQHKPGTSNAEQLTALEVQADACANRLSSFKIRDLIQNITTSDLIGPIPIYGGYIPRPGNKLENGVIYYDDLVRQLHPITNFSPPSNWYARAGVAGTTMNDGLHYIAWTTVAAKIAETCSYLCTPASDLTTAFRAYRDTFNQDPIAGWHNNCPVTTEYIAGSPFLNTGVCYEYLVGSDPRCDLNKVEMSSPVTLGWNASLADLAKRIAFQFGCYVRVEYDQPSKMPRIRFIDRSTASGNPLPSNWRPGKESRIAPKNIAAKRVELGYTGDSDRVTTPVLDGESLNLEIGWRVKARGGPQGPVMEDLLDNASVSQENQYSCWRPMTGGVAYGGHVIADGATLVHTGVRLYSVTHSGMFTGFGSTIDSSMFLKDGDPVAFSNGKYGTVQGDPTGFNTALVHMNDNTTGSGAMDVVFGYIRYAKDGVVSTTTTDVITSSLVDFTTGTGDHTGLIGQQFILPSIGVFTIIDTWTVSAGVYAAKLDRTIGTAGASMTFRIGGPQINPDGWLCGAYLLEYQSNPSNFYVNSPNGWSTVPDNANGWEDGLYHSTAGSLEGCYTISRWQYKGPTSGTMPDKSYGTALKSSLQFYGAQFLSTRSQFEKTFRGALADNGTITGYDVLDTFGEYLAGADRTFYSTGLELDELTGLIKSTFEEDGLTDNNIESFPVLRPGSSGGSSGGASSAGTGWSGGGGSSGGTTTSSVNALLNSPSTPKRNLAKATQVGVSPLELQRFSSGATDDLFPIYDELGNLIARFKSDGSLSFEIDIPNNTTLIKTNSASTFGDTNPVVDINGQSPAFYGRFRIYPDGTIRQGLGTTQSTIPGNIATSGAPNTPIIVSSVNQTATGYMHDIVINTTTGNRTVTLPNYANCTGSNFRVIKQGAANLLTVLRHDATVLISWAGNGVGYRFKAASTGWFWQ